MKYLHIKATSASLIIEEFNKNKNKNIPSNVLNIISQLSSEYPDDKFYVFGGDDISHPVKFENASNMLAAFCNIRTVPTKPMVYDRIDKSINLKRSELCDAVAKTGYVKFNSFIDNEAYVKQIVGDDGNYYNIYRNVPFPKNIGCGEMFKGEKLSFNSNRKETTEIYPDETPINGVYNYQTLLEFFMDDYNNQLYIKIRDFINDLFGTEDFQKVYNFKQMANKIYNLRKSSKEIDYKVDAFVKSIKNEWKSVAKKKGVDGAFPIWMYATFHQGKLTNSSNTYGKEDGTHAPSFLRERRDVKHFRITVDMEMIFKTNGAFEDAIRKGRGVASILDGGICEIVGLTDFEPEPNYEGNWTKI